jgi:signal recognition particle receptor subunit beta
MFINWALQEIHLKIVYYGPGLSGKTTNLEYIHQHIDPSLRSDLVALKTREERTIYFDFLQLEVGRILGKKPRFNLYTIPGQVYYAYSRKIILRGVDGIVFVADSQRERMTENLESLMDLELNLIEEGQTLERFPWVLQYNKRDLPDVVPVSVMREKLNYFDVPDFESAAIEGRGVFETLKEIINLTVASVHRRL